MRLIIHIPRLSGSYGTDCRNAVLISTDETTSSSSPSMNIRDLIDDSAATGDMIPCFRLCETLKDKPALLPTIPLWF